MRDRNAVVSMRSDASSLLVSPYRFRLAWCGILIIRVVVGAVANILAAACFLAATIQDGFYAEYNGLLVAPIIPLSFTVTGSLNWIAALLMVLASLRHRRLTFASHPFRFLREHLIAIVHKVTLVGCKRQAAQRFSTSFEAVYLTRSAGQTLLQTYQTYRCSCVLSRIWINHFYSFMLVLNCWSVPMIHFRSKMPVVHQKLLYYWSDALLDSIAIFVVPLFITTSLVTSVVVPSDTVRPNAFDVRLSDKALMDAVASTRQLLVTNWLDFCLKHLTFLSLAICVESIEDLLLAGRTKLVSPLVTSASVVPSGTRAASTPRRSDREQAPYRRESSKSRRHEPLWSTAHLRLLRQVKLPSLVVVCFALWGLAVIVIQTTAVIIRRAAPTSAVTSCESSLAPWFVRQYSCAVLAINCHRLHILGTADELEHVLSQFHDRSVLDLLISHCPHLEMPSRLHRLANLFNIDIFNSTIVDWNDTVALQERATPSIRGIALMLINMTTLPMGLQARDPPLLMHSFALAGSNLTALPTDLHTKWPNMLSFYVERAQLHEFPDTLAKMHIARLSLMDNHIEQIPDDLLRDNAFEILSLVGNPLRAWPSTIGNAATLTALLMDYTLVGTLPAWAVTEGRRRAQLGQTLDISAGGSTYCVSSNSDRTENGSTEAGLLIECREKLEEELEGSQFSFIKRNRAF